MQGKGIFIDIALIPNMHFLNQREAVN